MILFHSGDHGHRKGKRNKIFKDNIDYLKKIADNTDVMFTHTFAGEEYVIESLNPVVVFPMHDGGNEIQYQKYVNQNSDKFPGIKLVAAKKRGDCFFYKNGLIKSLQ